MNISANLLLVEGKDDEHVFYHLLKHSEVPESAFVIKNKEGVDALLESLEVELDASELERLGVVVDTDLDIEARWAGVRSVLARSGYENIPRQPDPDGTVVVQDGRPVVGIWLMPDNRISGILEDFIKFLIPDGDPLWPRAQDAVDGIPAQQRPFPESYRSKAQIHTWLAWQKEPGAPLGLAITKRYLDPDVAPVHRLMNWLSLSLRWGGPKWLGKPVRASWPSMGCHTLCLVDICFRCPAVAQGNPPLMIEGSEVSRLQEPPGTDS